MLCAKMPNERRSLWTYFLSFGSPSINTQKDRTEFNILYKSYLGNQDVELSTGET